MEPQILRRFLVLWASRIVLKTAITSNESLKNKFREAERTSIKLIETESHRSFNECCLIYIYMCVCVCVCQIPLNLLSLVSFLVAVARAYYCVKLVHALDEEKGGLVHLLRACRGWCQVLCLHLRLPWYRACMRALQACMLLCWKV